MVDEHASNNNWQAPSNEEQAEEGVTEDTVRSPLLKGMCALGVLTVVIVIGGAVFCAFEDWGFEEACFFAMTILTTVGYGSFVPATTGGKIWVVIFALFSIPVAGVCINLLTNMIISLVSLLLCGTPVHGVSKHNTVMIGMTSLMMHLLFCGGAMFSWLEGWDFGDSFYFSFVTLTTIGLGDFAPSTHAGQAWCIFFVLFGLGIISIMIEAVIEIAYTFPDIKDKIVASIKDDHSSAAVTTEI